MRILVLCMHNSARSQMAEGWLRHHALEAGLRAEIVSAGTEATRVKPEAIAAMREVGIDIGGQASKSLNDLPDPMRFDLVITVCDAANEACPSFPGGTMRLHASFPDPTGHDELYWREVRDALGAMTEALVGDLVAGRPVPAAWTVETA